MAAPDDGEVAAVDGEVECGTEVGEAVLDLPGFDRRPARVSREFSSASSSPTDLASSTARSALANAPGPGSWSTAQLATWAITAAWTEDGGRPRISSWAVPRSSQPSPRPVRWTSRERCTRNQAVRRGSPLLAPCGELPERRRSRAVTAGRAW